MSTIQTDEFKQRLLEERGRAQDALERLREDNPGSLEDATGEVSFYDNHPGDVATATFERELDEGLEEGAERRIEQIDSALKRIDDGTYGSCAVCGKPIGEERLRAAPWATLCIDDQRKQDNG
jgi:DnaK suppressor protein